MCMQSVEETRVDKVTANRTREKRSVHHVHDQPSLRGRLEGLHARQQVLLYLFGVHPGRRTLHLTTLRQPLRRSQGALLRLANCTCLRTLTWQGFDLTRFETRKHAY